MEYWYLYHPRVYGPIHPFLEVPSKGGGVITFENVLGINQHLSKYAGKYVTLRPIREYLVVRKSEHPRKLPSYAKSLATFSHVYAGMRSQRAVRMSKQSVATP